MDTSTKKAWPEYLLPHMPTAKEVLAKGDVYDLAGYQWTDDEMATLLVECAGLLSRECIDSGYEAGMGVDLAAEYLDRADNLLSFSLTHSSVNLAVFVTKLMLTHYNLPLHPGKMKHFSEFHRRCGSKIIAAVETPKEDQVPNPYWHTIGETFEDILDRNPRIVRPPAKKEKKSSSPSQELVEQRERQLAEKERIRKNLQSLADKDNFQASNVLKS